MRCAELGGAVSSRLDYWRAAVLDFLYPQECIVCGVARAVAQDACLCEDCLKALPLIGQWQCPRCGDQIGPHTTGRPACPSCAGRTGLWFEGATAVCRFEGVAREMVHRLKYNRDMRAVDWMGRQLAERLKQMEWFSAVDVLQPVPLHWTRRIARRFNQSELLAHIIGRRCSKRMCTGVLRRVRNTASQSVLQKPDREENVKGAFRVTREKKVKGRTILLVDDVMTTCATAAECARVLRKAGARRVYVAAFAR
jgi:ComF family protein